MFEKHSNYIAEMLVKMDAKNTVLNTKSDIRHSDLFAYTLKDIIRYVPQRKSWFYYDGVRWSKDNGGSKASELCKVIASELKKYVASCVSENEQYELMKNAKRWENFNFRKRILEDAKTTNPIDASLFDLNPYLINFLNGTFDLKTGQLMEHKADDFITKLASVTYDQSIENDRWNKFIIEIMSNDLEKAEYLQKVMGNSLYGGNKEECLYLLYGATTRNGKGTLMESVLGVLGDYGSTVRPETLATSNRNASSHSEDIARLNGVRLASISEPPKSMQFNASLVKTLTGGDTINARFLNENSFDFKPQMKIYISTNYLPSVNDSTVFSSNRIVVIPFDRHFSKQEQDRGLKTYFSSDELKSAILNWLIIGYYKSIANFDQPASVQNAIDNYEKKNNYIYIFLNDALYKDVSGKTPVAEAHRQFTNWAKAHGYEQLSLVDFGRKISKYVNTKVVRVNGGTFKCIISNVNDV